MIDAARKYGRSFSIGLRTAIEYRLNFVFSLLGVASPVVIQIALWTSIYTPGSGESLFGFTYPQMIAYTVVANLVSRLVRTTFEYEVNTDIRTGGLDRYLVKPIGYFGLRLFQYLGGKSAQMVLIALLLAGSAWVMNALLDLPVTAAGAALFAVGLVMALALNFLIFWCLSMLAFWLTEIGFFFEAARIAIITASGGVFPLSVLGSRAEGVLRVLPFRFTIQFPTELLCGRIPVDRAGADILLALGWIAVLTACARGLWLAGARRFNAVGG